MTIAIDIVPQPPTIINTSPVPDWRRKWHDRLISDSALARGRVGPDPAGGGWLLPFRPGDTTHARRKAYPGLSGPKNQWYSNGKPGTMPHDARLYDPAGDLAHRVAAADGVLILASGEPDVLVCWSADIFNVTCTMMGEGTIPTWFADELIAQRVHSVRVWPDRDDTGQRHARKVRAALVGAEIAVDLRALPYEIVEKHGPDLNTLWQDCDGDPVAFWTALESCAPLELPADQPAPDPSRRTDPPPAEYADLYERWCVEVVEAAAVTAWHIPARNGDHWSARNFSSPLREDRNPSARWQYEKHGFKDFATGEFYNTAFCADLLGVQTWPDYRADHAPAITRSNGSLENRSADDLHYAHGFPYTLTRALLTAKDKTVDRVDLAPLLIVDFLHTVCDMPVQVTISGMVSQAADRGYPVDRRTVAAGLTLAVETSMYSFAPIGGKDHKAIGAKVYTVLPIGERLRALGDYLAPRMAAPRRAPATASEIAAVLGESVISSDALDAARAGTLAAAAADRADHQRRAVRWLTVWEGSVRNILAGTYQPLALEPQALSAPKMRKTLARPLIADGIEVRRVGAVTGLSPHTVLKLAREAGLESVPQTVTIPADQVTATMRQRQIVISETDGLATIHTPNVFKRRDTLTADEQRAARHQQALQRGRAQRRLDRPQTATEARHRRDDARHHQADDTAARLLLTLRGLAPARRPRRDPLDTWLDYQWTLAPPLSPPIDPDTSEVLTGRVRWRAAFETVRSKAMVTFAAQTADKYEGKDRRIADPIRSSIASEPPELDVTAEYEPILRRAPEPEPEPADMPYLAICRQIMRGR